MTTINGKAVLTTGQVAQICHVAPRTVSKWFDRGQLGGYRIPGSRDRRIPVDELMAFMRANNIPLDDLDGRICRVLIVDEDADRGRGAEDLLEQVNGYQARAAASEFEAGVVAQQLHPHAVVLCIKGDVHAAREACQRVRKALESPDTRIIAACPEPADSLRANLQEGGFDDCVELPYCLESLLEAIEDAANVLT